MKGWRERRWRKETIGAGDWKSKHSVDFKYGYPNSLMCHQGPSLFSFLCSLFFKGSFILSTFEAVLHCTSSEEGSIFLP